MLRGLSRYWPALLAVLLSALWAILVLLVLDSRVAETVNLADAASESLIALLALSWIAAVVHARLGRQQALPLTAGFVIVYLGAFQDVLDEFLATDSLAASGLENVGIPTGMFLVSIGLLLWSRSNQWMVHQLSQQKDRYKSLSDRDSLTALYNRRYFRRALHTMTVVSRAAQQPVSLLMIDIDDFKAHNDRYGHAAGDEVLLSLSQLLRQGLRENDVPCRYGGEEFVVILPATARGQAEQIAERLRHEFAELKFQPTPESSIRKTLSVGVAELTLADTTRSFVGRADNALYAAKSDGKNTVRYLPAVHVA